MLTNHIVDKISQFIIHIIIIKDYKVKGVKSLTISVVFQGIFNSII